MEQIKLAFIVAVAENGAIGWRGTLPWHMPSDLRQFRRITLGKPVIMGRKTFQSIGKPLDGRTNIVVTRRADADLQNAIFIQTIDAAVAHAIDIARRDGVNEIMVIGGAQIYAALFERVERIYMTVIHGTPPGDAFFPSLPAETWSETAHVQLPRGERDDYDATFFILDRRERK
ncbi:MAG: dihydrofolate reductase [Pseudomonadota bacterium]